MQSQDYAELKALELSESLYVILAERMDGVTILIPDLGLDRPWTTRNKRLADDNASMYQRAPECRKAAAMTLGEAFTILRKQLAQPK